MTHEAALTKLRVGKYVSCAEELHKIPRRVTEVWQSEDKSIVLMRLSSKYGNDWLRPDMWDFTSNPAKTSARGSQ